MEMLRQLHWQTLLVLLRSIFMPIIEDVKTVLIEVLQLKEETANFGPSTGLFGSIPEFDSMAVVAVVAALEERFGISIEDDEITGDVFETVGSLSTFIQLKLSA